MKRLMIAASALAILGGSVSAAEAQPRGHHWRRGERLPPAYRGRNDYVSDYRAHRLRAPPRGYRWVRRDDNYLLVAATTGLIASVIAAGR